MCRCWTNPNGTMLENTGMNMKAGKSSASTSHHKAVPTWCKGTEKEQRIWQRPLGKIEKRTVTMANSFSLWHALSLWLKITAHFERAKQIKASYSAWPCSLLMASPWDGSTHSAEPHRAARWAELKQRIQPHTSTASASPRKGVNRQEGGQWCAQSKRRGNHAAQQADCAILIYFISADF